MNIPNQLATTPSIKGCGGMSAETVCAANARQRAVLSDRMRQSDCPDKFRAIAEWWDLHAEESADPDQALAAARSQRAQTEDMEKRPGHYRGKPPEMTCHQ